jgi:hypothetical protein
MPGIDDSEFILIGGQPLFSRLYLRGFSELMWGRELISTQTDLRIKLVDNINFSLKIGSIPLLSGSYLGVSIWYDYTELSRRVLIPVESILESNKSKFEAMGWEVRSAIEIIGIPTLHRFGQAWKPDFRNETKLEFYYMMEIPILRF